MKPGFANELAELLSIAARASGSETQIECRCEPERTTTAPAPGFAREDAARRAIKTWKAKKSAEKSIRKIANWQGIRGAILARDGYVCRICGADPCESQMHVHHVDWDRANNAYRNLVTLCSDCHRGIHAHGYRPDGTDDEPWGDRGQREE